MTAQSIFNDFYGRSKNFLTPIVIRYGKIGDNIVYELSVGDLLDHNLFGVTILYKEKNGQWERAPHLNRCFVSLEDAENHLIKIKQGEIEVYPHGQTRIKHGELDNTKEDIQHTGSDGDP